MNVRHVELQADDALVDIDWIATKLNLHRQTIHNWLSRGSNNIPAGFKIGKTRYWRKQVVLRWITEMEQQ